MKHETSSVWKYHDDDVRNSTGEVERLKFLLKFKRLKGNVHQHRQEEQPVTRNSNTVHRHQTMAITTATATVTYNTTHNSAQALFFLGKGGYRI
jgi:hypothetical protein